MNGYSITQILMFFGAALYLATILYCAVMTTMFIKEIGKYLKRYGKNVQDLYDWHKPEPDGQQSWKGHLLEGKIEDLKDLIKDFINGLKA